MFPLVKILISAVVIWAVSELAKRNNYAASVIHSLPLTSLLAFTWIYLETRDSAKLASHAHGTFWFVLPTLPLFLVLTALLRQGLNFWVAFAACIVGTFLLYLATMWLVKMLDIKF